MMKKNQYSGCFFNRNSIGHSKNKKNNYAGNSSFKYTICNQSSCPPPNPLICCTSDHRMSSAILSPPPSFRTATGGSRVTVCLSRDFYSKWLWWMEGTNSTRPDKQWIALQENNTNKIRLETHRSTPQTASEVGITGEVGEEQRRMVCTL